MARDSSPIRFVTDPSTPPALRAMVDEARGCVPDRDAVRAFAARLEAAIAANVAPPNLDAPEQYSSDVHDLGTRAASRSPGSAPGPGPGLEATRTVALGPSGWSLGAGIAVVLGGLIAGGFWFVARGHVAGSDARHGGPLLVDSVPHGIAAEGPAVPPERRAGSAADEDGTNGASTNGANANGANANGANANGANANGANANGAAPRSPDAAALRGDVPEAADAARATGATRPTNRERNAAAAAAAPSVGKEGSATRASDEAALLLSARSALASNPAAALRLTTEHAQRFPNGNLTEEREVIAIDALQRLGRSADARKRGAAFARHYPGSVHRSKVEQTLQEK